MVRTWSWVVAAVVLCLPVAGQTLKTMTLAEMIDHSDAIILGKVVGATTQYNQTYHRIYTYFTVKVEADDKRSTTDEHPSEVVVRCLGGTWKGLTSRVAGTKLPQIGERAYLFLEKDVLDRDHYRILGLTEGHFVLVDNPRTGKTEVQGSAPGLAELDPTVRHAAMKKGHLDSNQPVPSKWDLREFRAAVQQQVLRAQNPRYRMVERRLKAGKAPVAQPRTTDTDQDSQ